MDIIGAIKFRIEKISTNNRQKDILSLLYIFWFIILAMVFINVTINMLINTIGINIYSFTELFVESLKNNIIPNFKSIKYNFLDITDIIAYLKLTVPIIVTIIYVKYFEKMTFKTEVFYMLMNIILTMFLFLNNKTISTLIIVIGLLISLVPISSGRYFNVIKKIRYFFHIYDWGTIKISKRIIKKVVMKCFLIIMGCFLLAYLITPFISIYLGFFLCITLAIRIYMGINSEDKVIDIFRKIVLYISIIVIYIFLNKQLTADIDKLLGLIITIYFAWDRLFSISKDIEDLINDKSVLFYYEEEKISEKNLSKRYINFNFINKEIDEIELVIQILIRFNVINYKSIFLENDIELRKEIIELCKIYKLLNYKSYFLFIGYLEILLKKEQLSNEEIYLGLEKLFESGNTMYQKNYPLEAVFEYIKMLFNKNEYEKVISIYNIYLETYVKTLDKNIINILIDSAKEVDTELYQGLNKLT